MIILFAMIILMDSVAWGQHRYLSIASGSLIRLMLTCCSDLIKVVDTHHNYVIFDIS